MGNGKFITLEGGEGAGKSTHASLLAEALEAAGLPVVCTREPGGTRAAEEIRSLLVNGTIERWSPMTEALLHYAARREHLDTLVIPALQAGKWVVCDRFADSTMAYQGYGLGLGAEVIAQLHRLVVGALRPDLTLILDVPVALGLERAQRRACGGDRYERMQADFHSRLRNAFHTIAEAEPDRCQIIDATASRDVVQQVIRITVSQRLGVQGLELR